MRTIFLILIIFFIFAQKHAYTEPKIIKKISGGVSSIEDIKKAKTLKNIEGVIVGKAIYDGDIKLEELAKEDA